MNNTTEPTPVNAETADTSSTAKSKSSDQPKLAGLLNTATTDKPLRAKVKLLGR